MILLLTEPEAYTDFDGEISPSARAKGSFLHTKNGAKTLRLSSKCIFYFFYQSHTSAVTQLVHKFGLFFHIPKF